MERYRLKNIIILILVLLNAFLLVSLGIRGTKEHTARRAQQQELVALFAADGMTLEKLGSGKEKQSGNGQKGDGDILNKIPVTHGRLLS